MEFDFELAGSGYLEEEDEEEKRRRRLPGVTVTPEPEPEEEEEEDVFNFEAVGGELLSPGVAPPTPTPTPPPTPVSTTTPTPVATIPPKPSMGAGREFEPEPPGLIERGVRKAGKVVGLDLPLRPLPEEERAKKIFQAQAKERGITPEELEFERTRGRLPTKLERVGEKIGKSVQEVVGYGTAGAVESFGLGFPSKIYKGITGKELPEPTTAAGQIAFGLGHLAGFIKGPAGKVVHKVGEGVGKVLPKITAETIAMKRIPIATTKESIALGLGIPAVNLGDILNSSSVSEAGEKLYEYSKSGAVMGGIFGMTRGVIPSKGVKAKLGRITMGTVLLDAVGGTHPLDTRPLWQKFHDYGMGGVFLWSGIPSKMRTTRLLDQMKKRIDESKTYDEFSDKVIEDLSKELGVKVKWEKEDVKNMTPEKLADELGVLVRVDKPTLREQQLVTTLSAEKSAEVFEIVKQREGELRQSELGRRLLKKQLEEREERGVREEAETKRVIEERAQVSELRKPGIEVEGIPERVEDRIIRPEEPVDRLERAAIEAPPEPTIREVSVPSKPPIKVPPTPPAEISAKAFEKEFTRVERLLKSPEGRDKLREKLEIEEANAMMPPAERSMQVFEKEFKWMERVVKSPEGREKLREELWRAEGGKGKAPKPITPIPIPPKIERRKDTLTRERVQSMIKEGRGKEVEDIIFTDSLTGLKNQRGWKAEKRKKHQGMADADGLKFLNDNVSDAAGDSLLRLIGKAFKQTTDSVAREHGDEFRYEADSVKELQRIKKEVDKHLLDNPIRVVMPDGEVRYYRGKVTHGRGSTEEAAGQHMHETKKKRTIKRGEEIERVGEPKPEVKPKPKPDVRPTRPVVERELRTRGEGVPGEKVPGKGEVKEITAPEFELPKSLVVTKLEKTAKESSEAQKEFNRLDDVVAEIDAKKTTLKEGLSQTGFKTKKQLEIARSKAREDMIITGREYNLLLSDLAERARLKEKVEPTPEKGEKVKPKAWELGREEYIDTILEARPSTPSRPSNYINLVNRIKKGHEKDVRQAIEEGKIVSHPDYPKLKKKVEPTPRKGEKVKPEPEFITATQEQTTKAKTLVEKSGFKFVGTMEGKDSPRVLFDDPKAAHGSTMSIPLSRLTGKTLVIEAQRKIEEYREKGESKEVVRAKRRIKTTIQKTLKDEKGEWTHDTIRNTPLIQDLIVVGKGIIQKGHVKFKDFQSQMKGVLGNVWDKVKGFIREVYTSSRAVLKSQKGEVGIPPPPTPSKKLAKTPAIEDPEATKTLMTATKKQYSQAKTPLEKRNIALSTLAEIEKRAISSSGRVIERETPAGKQMVNLIQDTYRGGERLAGRWVADYEKVVADLTGLEKSNLARVLDGIAKPQSPKIRTTAIKLRKMLDEVAKLAGDTKMTIYHPIIKKWSVTGERGNWNLVDENGNPMHNFTRKSDATTALRNYLKTPFHPRENYFPRMMKRGIIEQRMDKVIDHLIKTGQIESVDPITKEKVDRETQERIARSKVTIYMRRNTERRYGNLQIARELDLPSWTYELNPDVVLRTYFERTGKRIAQADKWGVKDEKLREFVGKIAEQGGDHTQATRILDKILEKESSDVGADAISSMITGYNIVTKMGLSQIAQVTQNLSSLYRGNAKSFLKAIWEQATNKDDARDFALRTGSILKGVVKDAQTQMTGAEGKVTEGFLRKTLFTLMDLRSRLTASLTGKFYAEYLVDKLNKKPDSKFARRRLEQLTLDPDAILEKGGRLSEEDSIKAGQKFEIDTNFRNRVIDLPEFMTSRWGRVVTQFKSFSYAQTKLIRDHVVKEAVHGNVLPLVYLLVAGGISGEMVNDIRAWITGRERPDVVWKRVLENLSVVGAFGIMEMIFSTTKYGDPQLGPTVGTVAKGAKAVGYMGIKGKEGEKKLRLYPGVEFAAGEIPVVGSRVRRELVKRRKEKKEPDATTIREAYKGRQ